MASLREKGKVEIKAEYAEFAAPLWKQFTIVVWYVWQQHWRTRSYIWGKAAFCIGSSFHWLQFLQEWNLATGPAEPAFHRLHALYYIRPTCSADVT